MRTFVLFSLLTAVVIHSEVSFGETVDDGVNRYVLHTPKNLTLIRVGGVFSSILVHETGHALGALITFSKINSFNPFPHKSGNQFVGGAVGITPSSKIAIPIFTIMGLGAAMTYSYLMAPNIARASNVEKRAFWISSVGASALQFPFYVLAEFVGFKGDLTILEKYAGIPRWFMVIPAGVSTYVLLKRIKKYRGRKPNSGQIAVTIPKTPRLSDTSNPSMDAPNLGFDFGFEPISRTLYTGLSLFF